MKVIFVVGTTASGKSDLALGAAQKFNLEILNIDSLQVYKYLDVGTAKPTKEERTLVPHHLFDFVNPPETLTAGEYRKLALAKLSVAEKNGCKAMLIVGGSGFYVQALEKGMFELGQVDPKVHEEVQEQAREPNGLADLYLELSDADPEFASTISHNDSYRIQRAVEVLRHYGEAPSSLRAKFKPEPLPYEVIKVGASRPKSELLERVELRTQKMLAAGLIEEYKQVVAMGHENWPPLQSVGYRECGLYLKGDIRFEDLPSEIVKQTMRLAKKQRTWFQRDKEIVWFESSLNKAIAHIESSL